MELNKMKSNTWKVLYVKITAQMKDLQTGESGECQTEEYGVYQDWQK